MISSEFDGSWTLNVMVTNLQVETSLRVKGDLHIGGVMLKLVETLEIPGDWSDHSFYWPDKSLWLTRARTTLDQNGVQAGSLLWFTPMHKNTQIQLPDLSAPVFRINFSVNVFSVVIKLCKELGIRHPEELSLMRTIDPSELKRNQGASGTKSTNKLPTGMHQTSMSASNSALNDIRTPGSSGFLTPEGTLSRGHNPLSGHSPSYHFNANSGAQTPGSSAILDIESSFSGSNCSEQVLVLPNFLPKAKNVCELARLNSAWLDSSRSLMEQNVEEGHVLLLRFKFLEFYDLNAKYDQRRIHYIYEQAKWSMVSEEMLCSEDEMVMFAALQAQVEKQLLNQGMESKHLDDVSEDEVDCALTDLQTSLAGYSRESPTNLTQTPQLKDLMKCYRPRKFHVKSFKRYWFLLKDCSLAIYKQEEEEGPLQMFDLNGSEGFSASSCCNISSQKFLIKLHLPHNGSLVELWLRANDERQYTKWLAALRLAQHGKTMADVNSYENEVKSIESLLSLQMNSEDCPSADLDVNDLNAEHLLAKRYLSRGRAKHILQRVVNANSNMKNMSRIDAQVNYIKAWQMLPTYGFRYFIINLKNSKKEDLLGIGTDRLVRMDIKKGDILKTWMYKTIKTWSVNWENKQVQVSFEDDNELAFQCLTAGCKVVHEFIGGYIFLDMRSGDRNQSLDEELFHKLTGGWA